MAKTDFKSVDEYIATHAEDVQVILQRVRSTIRKALPDADEVISYVLYPAGDLLVEKFKDELALYEVSKGTIRFPLSQPVPVTLIERIAKFRAKEAAERAKGQGDAQEGWRPMNQMWGPPSGASSSMAVKNPKRS